jgi:hypothetical protein
MRNAVFRLVPVAALTALMLVGGCGDDPTAPGIEPQITNLSDAFSYQVSSIQSFTGTYSYTWQNTGTVAKITHASDAGATGSATLTVRDAEGAQVYSGQLATSGEPLSDPVGASGAWTITLVYSDYSNTQVNFAVLKQ